ncbi:DUF3300 domain-containing protein [Colwellia echini]|uniref:DUF3300 domain-containing protein n=1 Tax=Colwellia echini TaxID=1982103 RepID=A0ABY3MWV3_9GAMM|nr:DUF3300 domain-containing protein [Colwellia echini]TYK65547.1 DUF3300 domain-containing protein [Colwellia echini]
MYFKKLTSHYRTIIKISLIATTMATVAFTTTAFSASHSTLTADTYQESQLSDAELAQALAPIALYPDTLLTHILISSTYPIEVIEAERWLNQQLQENSQITTQQLEVLAENKGWDASVQALLAFPKVLNKLSDDLSWMQDIGDTFLQDESRVLSSIQTLRQQAEQAGSLDNINNVKIVKEQQTIIIEPAQAEIIYVPYYDTRVVYGPWSWSNYPPIYWHNSHHYAAHYGHFYWGSAVRISPNFYFTAFHWQKRHVVVTPHISYRHVNRHVNRHVSSYGASNKYYSNRRIVTSNQAKRWSHKPTHRRGVAYNHKKVQQRYHTSRPTIHSTNTHKKTLTSNTSRKRVNKSTNHKANTRNNSTHRDTAVKNNNYKKSHQQSKSNQRQSVQSNKSRDKTASVNRQVQSSHRTKER